MAFPSHVLAAGNSPMSTRAINGTGTSGIVALGTTIADATQLSTTMNRITTSSASTGVILPPTEEGMEIWIRNDSGQTITIYPKAGSTINAAASTITIATAKTMILKADSATTWMTNLTA